MKVECVLTNPLLVEHVGPVLRVLQQRGVSASFVSVPPARRFVSHRREKHELHERCVVAAQQAELPCVTECDPRAHVALTALGSNQLQAYRGIKLKVRYGVTLHRAALHHNRAMTYGFDGMLVHGAFERDLFSRWLAPERIKPIGMPRHAAYLASPLAKEAARAQLGLRGDRPVIAYLPTWSAQSSLHSFAEALGALAQTHQLLVKPHPLSLASAEERGALAALERRGARFATALDAEERAALGLGARARAFDRSKEPMQDGAQHDARAVHGGLFAQLIAAADLVVADATSGAATEAALLAPSTPLLLLSLRTPTELFQEIEQLGPLVRDPAALAVEVARHLEHDEQRAQRVALCSRLFTSEHQGPAPELAADAILELARLPKISGGPGLFDRLWPRAARVARGRAIALAIKWAPVPPRDLR